MTRADEVDYQIHGHAMQYVEVELDPGKNAASEAGAIMCKEAAIEMTTVFGDTAQQNRG